MTCVAVSFAGSTLAIECDGGPAVQLARQLLRGEPAARPSSSEIRYRLGWDATRGRMGLSADPGADELQWGSVEQIAALLLERAGYDLADRCRTGLVFHAAAVRRHGRLLALPGPSGSGKSTLSAWLGTHGFEWLGDELAFVPAGTTQCEAFSRPLGLKDPARAILRDHLTGPDLAGRTISLPGIDYISGLGTANGEALGRQPLGGLLFPAFAPGTAAVALAPLSRARAAQRLLGCLLNARNLPGHGVDDAVRLAGTVAAAGLMFGPLEETAPAVDAWWTAISGASGGAQVSAQAD